ncbi:MAG: selenide, water dikinase SelD [Bdellovibrionota bacterium]
MNNESIALTQTVQKGGCAAKVAASELRKILSQVKFPSAHAELLVDSSLFDDAAIYKVSDDVALVQTLDFFTPILDSPRWFGAVAAANALSDVYAMGGKPRTAMGILAFPITTMSTEVIVDILQGASDKIAEAKANFVGGHSIDDDTLKFGLSVTGFVHPDKVWSNASAKIGDHLILTKALGTGTITAALKRREVTETDIMETIHSMATLNNIVDFLTDDQISSIHAATDITGFGLSGHSMQMAKASNFTFRITFKDLPILPKAMDFLERGFLTKAHKSNSDYTAAEIKVDGLSPLQRSLLHDPQTSGGLLLCVNPKDSTSILENLKKQFPFSSRIGVVEAPSSERVIFE